MTELRECIATLRELRQAIPGLVASIPTPQRWHIVLLTTAVVTVWGVVALVTL